VFSLFAYFALLNSDDVVKQVIVADRAYIDSHPAPKGMKYVETFMDGRAKKNYAGPGYKFSHDKFAFIPPKPFESFILDEETARWKAPVEYPKDGKGHVWDEGAKAWKEIVRSAPSKEEKK
jgi:hypothetical protein